MKTRITSLSLIVLLFIAFQSCKKDKDPTPVIIEPIDDNSLPSAAVLGVNLLEKNDNQLRVHVNLAVFRDSKNIEDNLQQSDFHMDSLTVYGVNYGFSNNSTRLISGSSGENYSALMLMDQSGSILTTDENDYRLDAAKIFCQNLGPGNDAALWSFSYDDYNQLVKFTTDTSTIIQEIENLRDQEGGSTPLYESQFDAITFTKTQGRKSRKAVLTFTDGEDTGWDPNSADVVEHAKEEIIALYNIGLGEVNTDQLLQQAIATNGGFMYAKDARQLISIFGNLGKLLANTATFYQTEWTISGDQANAFPSYGSISQEIIIHLPYGGEVRVPLIINY